MPLFGPPNIGKLAEKRDVKVLIKALFHNDYQVRRDAAEALAQFSDRRVEKALIAALRDEDSDVRARAATGVGQIGTADSVPALVLQTFHDHSYQGPKAAARALEAIREEHGLEPYVDSLITALKEKDRERRRDLLVGLRRFMRWRRTSLAELNHGPPTDALVGALITALDDQDEQVRARRTP
jgi:HEAT repeat protein